MTESTTNEESPADLEPAPGTEVAERLFVLRTDTPVHVGSSSTLSVVDLPIARERLTRFPIFPGSGLKGALRQHAEGRRRQTKGDVQTIRDIFGPETNNASEHAGAVSCQEARILLFPVRSLKGLFVWLTCPTVLRRLIHDAPASSELEKTAQALLKEIKSLPAKDDQVLASSDTCTLRDKEGKNPRLVVEEFAFTQKQELVPKVLAFAKAVAALVDDEGLAQRVAVVNDDVFRFLTLTATEVTTHVSLNPETKTADEGKLFNAEALPVESVLYARLVFFRRRRPLDQSKKEERVPDADAMEKTFTAAVADEGGRVHFQIGGYETTGLGRVTGWLR